MTSSWGRHAPRAIVAGADGNGLVTIVVVTVTLLAAWVITFASGGTKTFAPHLFYVPIVIATARFGRRGALAGAVLSGFLVGPLMPFDTDAGTAQAFHCWGPRAAMFVIIGQTMALYRAHSVPAVRHLLQTSQLRGDLQDALRLDQFKPVYQPIVDLGSGRIVGVEALARWHHRERGVLGAVEFIAAAESTGMINEIDMAVLRAACRDVAAWREGELATRSEFKLAVNISARHLDDPNLYERVRAVLAETGVPARWVCLEVTETALTTTCELAIERVTALRSLGVRIALDDFGVGHSTLALLRRLPIDVIKIDKSFVDEIHRDERAERLFAGVMSLALSLATRSVVVEGIELEAQARKARQHGTRLAQGFLFYQPLSHDDVLRALSQDQLRRAAARPAMSDPRIRFAASFAEPNG